MVSCVGLDSSSSYCHLKTPVQVIILVFSRFFHFVMKKHLVSNFCIVIEAHLSLSRFSRVGIYHYMLFFKNILKFFWNSKKISLKNIFKVSLNTRLARDLSTEEEQVTLCTSQKPPNRFESSGDCVITSRYYFPSVQKKLLQSSDQDSVEPVSNKMKVTEPQSEESVTSVPSTSDTCSDSFTNSFTTTIVTSSSSSEVHPNDYVMNEHVQAMNINSNAPVTPIDLSNKSLGKLFSVKFLFYYILRRWTA